jgi:hypothetical protein
MMVQPSPLSSSSNGASAIIYQALVENEIRVVKVHPSSDFSAPIVCTLRKDNLNGNRRNPGIIALSYVWGDPKATRPIRLNGVEYQITINLTSALRHIRALPGLTGGALELWVDAICINQRDLQERSRQVELMGDLYSQASSVIVWLGEAENDSDLAMRMIEVWAAFRSAMFHLSPSEIMNAMCLLFVPRAWKAINRLFKRPFWRRIWVQQEIILGRQVVLTCGLRCVRWEAFDFAVSAWHEFEKPINAKLISFNHLTLLQRSGYKELFSVMACKKAREGWLPALDMLDLLDLYFRLEASDPRDQIYALIGLAKAKGVIIPDYSKPVKCVFEDFARKMIYQQRDLRIILHAGVGIPRETNLYKLPSWVPDWSYILRSHPKTPASLFGASKTARMYYRAAGKTKAIFHLSVDCTSLCIKGTAYDRISHLARIFDDPLLYSEGERAWESFIYDSGQWSYPPNIPPLQAFFRTVLIDVDFISYTRLNPGSESFFDLASAFLSYLGYDPQVSHQQTNELDTEYDYISGLLNWLRQSRDGRSDQTILEPFLGPSSEDLAIKWMANGDRKRGSHSGTAYLGQRNPAIGYRRLFRTEKGYMGLAPPGALKDDFICVLLGLHIPLVLRKVESHYILVGECFVLGLMDGEALQNVDDGKSNVQDFEIH